MSSEDKNVEKSHLNSIKRYVKRKPEKVNYQKTVK